MPRIFLPAQPPLAAELDDGRLSMVRVSGGGRPELAGFFTEDLPAGAFVPSPAQSNIGDPDALRQAIRRARACVAPTGGPMALCLPDTIFRISVITVDALPRGVDAQRDLVGWRLKKTLPYRIEDAQLAWQVLGQRPEGTMLLAAAAKRRVVADIETIFDAEGLRVGCVTAGTLVLCELLPRTAGATLFVHAAEAWFSLVMTNASLPTLFRCKSLPAGDRSASARESMIAAEIAPTLEYHVSRLGGSPLERCVLHQATREEGTLAQRLQDALSLPVETIAVTAGMPRPLAGRLSAACALARRGLRAGGAVEAA
jgi:hypothetical protein